MKKTVRLSQIFDWYKDDFGKAPAAVLAWINRYRAPDAQLATDAKISYIDYDWRLNGRAPPALMRVAVVVPVLDERAIATALCVRLEDLARRCEVVVVDGGSSDGTAELLEERAAASGFRLVRSARGRGTQMDAGAAVTRRAGAGCSCTPTRYCHPMQRFSSLARSGAARRSAPSS